MYVAEDRGRIVGSYLLILQTLLVSGQACLAAHSVGTVVHADYTRHLTREGGKLQTVFARLAEMACDECVQRGIALTFSFPNDKSYPTFVKLLGFTDMGLLPVYARPVRPGAFVAARLPGPRPVGWIIGSAANLALALASLWPAGRSPRGADVEEVTDADARFDALWQRCQPIDGVMRRRDAAYVRWRMLEHPSFRYRVLLASRGATPIAWLATMTTTQKDRTRGTTHVVGHVVDFLCGPDAEAGQVLAGLVGRAVGEMHRDRVEFIIAGHSGPGPASAALRRGGLHRFSAKRAPRKWPAIVRVHRPDLLPTGARVDVLDRWYFNLADNDTV